MLILDIFLYLALFLWLDQILPNEYGIKKKPYFFITDLLKYLGCKLKSLFNYYFLSIILKVMEENRPMRRNNNGNF